MTTRTSPRGRLLAPVLVLLLAAFAHAETRPPAAAPDPADVRARDLAGLTPAFVPCVFTGDSFPVAIVDQQKFGPLLGDFTVKTSFCDPDYQLARTPEKAGPYAAVVEIVPKAGRPLRRFVTLFHSARAVPADLRFRVESADTFAAALGLDPAVVRRQAQPITEALRDRPFAQWSQEPRAAGLLAGLSRAPAGEGPVHKYDDPAALERQWWVGLKRRLNGWDRLFPRPFEGPTPLEGKPATVVRPGTPEEAGVKPDTAAKIDRACRDFAADTDQAFAVCVVRHGVIVHHQAYGTRDGKPMTVETPSWMASVTKTMAATCMLMLIDRGLVGLDDPVDRFFPSLSGIEVKKPLTVHHLYTHTNGLTLGGRWAGWNDDMPDVAERLAAYYDRLEVGAKWDYTGTGNILGGKIIEAVSGEAVPQFYHRHLLAPLGCEHTEVAGSHADAHSVPLDMARFGQMLLNGGSYGRWQFFREKTFRDVMVPHPLTKLLGPGARSFGFGLDGNDRQFGHGAASAATFHVDTANDLVVIMTRNKQGKNQDKYNGPIWEAIRGGLVKEGAIQK